jgi:chemotaxis protein CheD
MSNYNNLNRTGSREDKGRKYVSMGEMVIGNNPDLLMIVGLGSCIALCLYDGDAKVGGMAHIMLPELKSKSKSKKELDERESRSCKYADRAVSNLLREILESGAKKWRIAAKIAGGASLFPELDTLRIGEKNEFAIKKALEEERIKLLAEDTGGNYGRTVTLNTCTGELMVKTKNGIKAI